MDFATRDHCQSVIKSDDEVFDFFIGLACRLAWIQLLSNVEPHCFVHDAGRGVVAGKFIETRGTVAGLLSELAAGGIERSLAWLARPGWNLNKRLVDRQPSAAYQANMLRVDER